MKRLLRRVLAVAAGLFLGWQAAAWLEAESLADDPHRAEHAPAVATQPGEADGEHAAHALVPGPGQTPWLVPVLAGMAGLFAAALVLGPAALKLRGPEPAEPDHGHGHGHDHHDAGHAAP